MQVEFFGLARERAGIPGVEVQAETLGQLFERLAAQIPSLAEFISANRLQPVFAANLNGERFVSDPAVPLCENDHLIILSADAGG